MKIVIQTNVSEELAERIKKALDFRSDETKDILIVVLRPTEQHPDPWGKRNFIPKDK